MLDVRITVDEKDWDTIRSQTRDIETEFQEKRKFQPINHPYTYVEASVSIDEAEFPQVGIRKKVHWFAKFQPLPQQKSDIEGLTNLTFNNNQQDSGLMIKFMSYALFNQAGSPAPRCTWPR